MQDQLQIHSKFEANMGYLRPFVKKMAVMEQAGAMVCEQCFCSVCGPGFNF